MLSCKNDLNITSKEFQLSTLNFFFFFFKVYNLYEKKTIVLRYEHHVTLSNVVSAGFTRLLSSSGIRRESITRYHSTAIVFRLPPSDC